MCWSTTALHLRGLPHLKPVVVALPLPLPLVTCTGLGRQRTRPRDWSRGHVPGRVTVQWCHRPRFWSGETPALSQADRASTVEVRPSEFMSQPKLTLRVSLTLPSLRPWWLSKLGRRLHVERGLPSVGPLDCHTLSLGKSVCVLCACVAVGYWGGAVGHYDGCTIPIACEKIVLTGLQMPSATVA